jgi:hypothetical protein
MKKELEKKLLLEVARFKEIGKNVKLIMKEQTDPNAPPPPEDAGLPPAPGAAPDAGADAGLPPAPGPAPDAMGGDTGMPPAPDSGMGGDMPPAPDAMGGEGDMSIPTDNTEEIDITDLVNMTKSIKMDLDDSKSENSNAISKMDDIFGKLNDLEQKLGQMDMVISKIDELGTKVSEMKPKSPEQELEMRSLDSYPFNKNPQQFFKEKQGEMRATGKDEYVLTKQDVDNYSQDTMRHSFNPEQQKDDFTY